MELEVRRDGYTPYQKPVEPEIDRGDRSRKLNEDSDLPVVQKVISWMDMGKYRQAAHLLRSILMVEPTHLKCLELMAKAMMKLGQLESALKFAKFLYQKLQSAETAVKVAEISYLLEKDRVALEYYRLVLSHGTENRDILFETFKNMGNIFVRSADFEAAQENYDKAYAINPKSDTLNVNYGTLAIQKGDMSEALNRFREALEINSENDKAWVGLALAHRHLGDIRLAWANLERALDCNPKNRTAVRFLIEWAVHDQRIGEAIPWVRQYLTHDFEDAETSYQLGKLLIEEGLFADAALELERVLALDPTFEEAAHLRRVLNSEMKKRGLICD